MKKKIKLANSSKCSATKSFSFDVMSFQPQGLELWMIMGAEGVAFENLVKLLEITPMKGDNRLGF